MPDKVLIGYAIGCAVFLVIIVALAWFGGRWLMSSGMAEMLAGIATGVDDSPPEELRAPGVRLNALSLEKREALRPPGLGEVTDILFGQLDGKPGEELGLAGKRAAAIVRDDGELSDWAMFSGDIWHVDIVDVEWDGTCEYMNRDGWSDEAILFDHRGRRLWSYRVDDAMDDMAAGDVNADGLLEFVVGYNGSGGVRMLDSQGRLLWHRPDGNVWHVEIVDLDGDGDPEILHSGSDYVFTVRDPATGSVTLHADPEVSFGKFALCPWPDRDGAPHAVTAGEENILLLDRKGRTAATLPAPSVGKVDGNTYPVLVKLLPTKPAYLAVVAEYWLVNRSLLYIYDSSGQLVYQEVLADRCASIAARPVDKSGREAILVGGEGRVWQYQAVPTAGKR